MIISTRMSVLRSPSLAYDRLMARIEKTNKLLANGLCGSLSWRDLNIDENYKSWEDSVANFGEIEAVVAAAYAGQWEDSAATLLHWAAREGKPWPISQFLKDTEHCDPLALDASGRSALQLVRDKLRLPDLAQKPQYQACIDLLQNYTRATPLAAKAPASSSTAVIPSASLQIQAKALAESQAAVLAAKHAAAQETERAAQAKALKEAQASADAQKEQARLANEKAAQQEKLRIAAEQQRLLELKAAQEKIAALEAKEAARSSGGSSQSPWGTRQKFFLEPPLPSEAERERLREELDERSVWGGTTYTSQTARYLDFKSTEPEEIAEIMRSCLSECVKGKKISILNDVADEHIMIKLSKKPEDENTNTALRKTLEQLLKRPIEISENTLTLPWSELKARHVNVCMHVFTAYHQTVTSFEGAGLDAKQMAAIFANLEKNLMAKMTEVERKVDLSAALLLPPSP